MIALTLTGLQESNLLSAFFSAMLSGSFLHGSTPEEGPFEGWKKDRYFDGLIQIVDIWGPRPDAQNVSTGITTLYYREVAIWQMKYEGEYTEEALPFLKVVLKQSYGWRVFRGGRGMNIDGGTLCYSNEPIASNFACFAGKEQIWRSGTTQVLGAHTYSGGYLF